MTFDASSVVEVLGESGSYGSGYEVDAGLVLTAGHILTDGVPRREPTSAQIRFMQEGADWVRAYVIWYDDCLDAALLAVATDRSFTAPVRYGELTGADPQHPVACGVVGFPQVQATRHGRDPMGVSGTVDASTQRFSRRYQIELTSLENRRDWSGMSGAAVFCGPLLIAVIRSVPEGFHAARVNAIPVGQLLRSAAFRGALFGTGCVEPVPGRGEPHSALRAPCNPECEVPPLESVELEPLLEAPPRPGPRALTAPHEGGPSVSYLLHPRVRTVPFIGRGPELRCLRRWADSARPFDAMTVTGPMGAGKTRLAVELAQCLGDDWVTGFLRTEPPHASPRPALHPLTTSARPLLLVIDYAETRPAWLGLVLRTVAGHRGRARVRLLLLSRVAGQWQDDVLRQCEHLGFPADAGRTLRLGTLEPHDHEATVPPLSEAAHAFARRLYIHVPLYELFEPLVDGLLPDSPLADPFSLSLAACAAAISAFEGAAPGHAALTSPYEVVLAREERYWMRGADASGLAGDRETLLLLRTLVVTQALCGARNRLEAAAAVRAGRSAHYRHWGADQPRPDQLRTLHNLLGDLYPSHDAEWGHLGPHALSAHLIDSAERHDRGLTQSILTAPGLARDQRRRGLETVLLGASHRPGLTGLAHEVADALDERLPPWFTEEPQGPTIPEADLAPQDRFDNEIDLFPDTGPDGLPGFRKGPGDSDVPPGPDLGF
ncbi:serine protease [Streptomyces sp. NBC_01450]|uniref:serine protease n=1 Tax=Streptomyces sp. NBC_01450 TaxID=2903871 RepID=UPI002E2EF6D1|nr:serine protease [Streptomyces sp. NBC_01450]